MNTSRAVAFNNAGVLCLQEGIMQVAIELFTGAMEIMLASIRGASEATDGSKPSHQLRHIALADAHMEKLTSYFMDKHVHKGCGGLTDRESYSTDFYLYDKCFRIDESLCVESGDEDQDFLHRKKITTSVVFNLALTMQIRDPTSSKPLTLYKLVMTLLRGSNVGILGIAVINNIAIWSVDNHDFHGAQRCFERLSAIMQERGSLVRPDERDGFYFNLVYLLVPPSVTSPAA